ncbi:MAG: hypothetical protein IJT02_02840 [Synergistaceae bacterium]|nr:hypothetical protein [Synergistaceae bacterium]
MAKLKHLFRTAKSLLYRFPLNLMRLQELQQAIAQQRTQLDVQAHSYEAQTASTGTHSDPVALLALRVMSMEEQLRRIEQRVVPVLRLRNRLKNSGSEDERVRFYIMELYYFEDIDMVTVMLHLYKRSIGYMRRQKRKLLEQLVEEVEKFGNSL